MNEVDITFDASRFDVNAIHAHLSQSYWAKGIPHDVVKKAIHGSLSIGALAKQKQIGFARLVTDRATFAYLADVYVLEECRGQGLSRKMLNALFAHPDVQHLRRMMLVTCDAHGLCAQFGFTPLASPLRVMERHDPDVY